MTKLTEADQMIFDSLIDPDQATETRYPFDDDFLRILLGILLSNRFFLSQSIGLIKPTYFRNEIHQIVCKLLFQYFDKYKQLPSKIFVKQLIDDHLKAKYQNDDKYRAIKIIYIAELNLIYDYYTKGGNNLMPTLDSTEAILDKITSFARTQAMKAAWAKSVDLIKKNPEADETWNKIDELYKEARLVNRNFDIGLDYFESPEARYARLEANAGNIETFSLGFRSLDKCLTGGGLMRGELGAVMALAGTGKSLWLTWVSVQNILKGKKVLYISTEMDQDRIASRFDSMFSQIGQHELMARKEEVWRALRNIVSNDEEDKRRLIIKQFPSGTADMTTVRAYCSQLEMVGFKPDLVIYDYPGDFKDYAGLDLWHSRYRMLREIRGFAVEERHCALVAIHPNRSSKDLTLEEFMDEGNTGDSFKQNQVFDFFLTLNQTSIENRANIARAFVAKARNGKSRFPFWIRFHFKDQTLRLEEISRQTYMLEYTKINERTIDDMETDINKISEDKHFEPSDGERIA